MTAGLLSFIRSGWSFFFRWPHVHTDDFRPAGLFLGPLFQTLVVGLGVGLSLGLSALGTPLNLEEAQLFLSLLVLSIWTGFFHEDGLADTADGFGPAFIRDQPQSRERILKAMKDSRLGTYGVCALVLLWLFRFELLWAPRLSGLELGLAIFWSRALGLGWGGLLAGPGKGASAHTLGTLRRSTRLGAFVGLMALGLALCGLTGGLAGWAAPPFRTGHLFAALLLATLLCPILLIWFRKRTGFLNGDQMGASICCIEIFLIMNFHLLTF